MRQSLESQRALLARRPPRNDLVTLYRLWQGPIATTLENQREPFLPVDPIAPGKNVYPPGADQAGVEAFLAEHPQARNDILNGRTVVRAATDVKSDLAALLARPALETLHPGLRDRIRAGAAGFYAIPYALAYADDLDEAGAHLLAAARAVRAEDEDLADYVENRRRDFLTNDYESGDASWISGSFRNLNAQIGSYETCDDELFGVKTFMSHSVLVRDQDRTRGLRAALRGIQAIEDALPYAPHRRVRENLPVGVYHVVADFRQARGTNTASILPNESRITRKYGRQKDVYAAGILRVLQKNQPRRGQPYQTMQLMQMNYFLEKGLLEFDSAGGRLRVHYPRYPEVVASMLERVLAIQAAGDKSAAGAFIEQYDTWTPELHERLGRAMRATEKYRYRLVQYQALGE